MREWAIIPALSLLVLLIPTAQAHSPSSVTLTYDQDTDILNVTITHSVASTSTHYIEKVEVYVNDALVHEQDYTSQPTTSAFSYEYTIMAGPGDTIKVDATCNLAGTDSETLIIPDDTGLPTIDIMLFPQITSIDEETSQEFEVHLSSDSTSLEGAEVTAIGDWSSGFDTEDDSDGMYSFTYNAPSIFMNFTEVLRITASKTGYKTAYYNHTFTIVDVPNTKTEPDNPKQTLDGVISEFEYEHTASFGDGKVTYHWLISGTMIKMAMVGQTDGWVAIGFDPTTAMKGADIIIGSVDSEGNVLVEDTYGTEPFGDHPSDISLGGTDDILAFGGTTDGSITTIEFERKLVSSDGFDKDIPADGKVKIIWAISGGDDFVQGHTSRGTGEINFGSGEAEDTTAPNLWPVHAGFMILALLCFVGALVMARFKGKNDWWMKAHHGLIVAGGISGVLGIINAFAMLQGQGHFRVPHAYLGALVVLLLITTAVFGILITKVGDKAQKIGTTHRWFARVILVLMLLTIIGGFAMVMGLI